MRSSCWLQKCSNALAQSNTDFNSCALSRYIRSRPLLHTETTPTLRSTLRCLDTAGCGRPMATTSAPTGSVPRRASTSRICRRRGSAMALKTSVVVAARGMSALYSHVGICQAQHGDRADPAGAASFAWSRPTRFVSVRLQSSLLGLPAAVKCFIDGPKLNAHAERKCWVFRQQPDGLIQVLEREHHDAAEAFLGFRKGTIGDDDLARFGPQCLGGAGTLQSDATQPLSALDALLVEGDDLFHHGLEIAFRGRAPTLLVDVAEAGEFHALRVRGRPATAPFRDECRLTVERLFVDRPNLERGTVAKAGVPGHQLDGFSHVAGLQDADSAELLLRFGEGPVGNQHGAVLPAQDLGGATRLQCCPVVNQMPIFQELPVVGEAVLDHGVLLAFGHGDPVFFETVSQECEFHQ